MTDGIIQKVFETFYKEFVLDSNRNQWDINHEKILLEELEQELIEKIKQEFIQFNSWDRDLIQRILIGDNQK